MLVTKTATTNWKARLGRVGRRYLLLSKHLEFVEKSCLQFDQVIDLLDHREFGLGISNLRDFINLNKVSQSGKLNRLNLFLSESILLLIDLLEFPLLFRREFAKLIHQEALLPDPLYNSYENRYIPYLFLFIFHEYLVDVDMKPHEFCKTLLSHQSLSLQVALLDALGGQHT